MDRGKKQLVDEVRVGISTASSSSKNKKEAISPPFSWLTDRRAVVQTKDYLLSHGISAISGEVECKKCKHKEYLVYDLRDNFAEVASLIAAHLEDMDEPETKKWMRPALPGCPRCGRAGGLSPVLPRRKRDINWLFLFLGKMLGVCSIDQLRYFCKHNKVYPTGREDRALVFVYIGICLQLDPGSLF